MPLSITLFCSHCGKSIGSVVACPECGEDNEFLKVTPPEWVVKDFAEETEYSPSPPAPRIPTKPAPPDSVTPQVGSLRDQATRPLPLEDESAEDDRTIPLPAAQQNPVAAVLICKDDCSPGQEMRFELREGEVTVGRRNALLLVPSEHVSKRHAVIRVLRAEPGFRIDLVDVGSGNGTFVNGQRLVPNQARELRDNDTVAFANVQFRFRTSEYARGGTGA